MFNSIHLTAFDLPEHDTGDLAAITEKRPAPDVSMLDTCEMPAIKASCGGPVLCEESGETLPPSQPDNDDWLNSQQDDSSWLTAFPPSRELDKAPAMLEYDIPAGYTRDNLHALIVRACKEFYAEYGEAPYIFVNPLVGLDVHLIQEPEALDYRRFVFPSQGLPPTKLLCKGGTGVR